MGGTGRADAPGRRRRLARAVRPGDRLGLRLWIGTPGPARGTPDSGPQAHVRHACERDEPGRTGAQHAYAHGATAGSDFHRARDTADG